MKWLRKTTLFWHVPKCGGTSVKSVAKNYYNFHCHTGAPWLERGDGEWHYGSTFAMEKEAEYKFALIRHPLSRLLSICSVMQSRRPEGCTLDWCAEVATSLACPVDRERGVASDHEIWTHTRPYASLGLIERGYQVFQLEEVALAWPEIQKRAWFTDPIGRHNTSDAFTDRIPMPIVDRVLGHYVEDCELWQSVSLTQGERKNA